MIILYNLLLFIGLTLGIPVIIPLFLLSEKRRKTVFQRLGLKLTPELSNRKPKTENRIWIHALSVGEVLSALPLVEELRERFGTGHIVFSASTSTGFETADRVLKEKANFIFFFPYDLLFSVRRIADRINPDLVVIVETDIWPNFMYEMKKRQIPVIWVNARLSEKSFRGFRRFSFFTKALFAKFHTVCTQTAEEARRFALLGLPEKAIFTTGNIKFDQADSSISDTEIKALRRSLNITEFKRVIVAGSTHEGEEEILSDAFSRLKKTYPDLMIVLAPRDPARGKTVSRLFINSGYSVMMLSEIHPDFDIRSEKIERSDFSHDISGIRSAKIERSGFSHDVLIIDRIGLLRKLYALADIAFVGGSLLPFGGHNPLEPAAFSKPILFGPDMSDFREIAAMLLNAGAAVQVRDSESFYKAAAEFLEDKIKAQSAGRRAGEVFYGNKGAVEKTVKKIEACLSERYGVRGAR